MLFGLFFLWTAAVDYSEWRFGQMFIVIIILAIAYYLNHLFRRERPKKTLEQIHQHGYQEAIDFKNNNKLQINHLPQYFPLAHSAKYLFLGSHKNQGIELILNTTDKLSIIRGRHVPTDYYVALIVNDTQNIPNFSITPKEYGDRLFVSQSRKVNDLLPTAFTKKYHIQGSVQDVREIPIAFFEYIAERKSRMFLESNGKSLAIYKEGQVITHGWEIHNILTRAEILLDLLTEESSLQKSYAVKV